LAYEKLMLFSNRATKEQIAKLKKIACRAWFIMTKEEAIYSSSLSNLEKDNKAPILSMLNLKIII
jgi:hypothetical protein